MAKKTSIHKDYNFLEVIMTNGSKVMMKSTYQGKSLSLTIDKFTHPAWTKQTGFVNEKVSQVAKFHQRFGDLGMK